MRTELRSLLGLCNEYRRFIKDFKVLAHPLNKLLKKVEPDRFELDEDQLRSFPAFIDRVSSPPNFASPIPDLPYSVDTDVCNYGIGCTPMVRESSSVTSQEL